VFHSIRPTSFEKQIRYLVENNYHTLKADELYGIVTEKKRFKQKAVVLTFDDGLRSLRCVAYPLLKKYGLSAISFIVPFRLDVEAEKYSNLLEMSHNDNTVKDFEIRKWGNPLCNWNEIEQMHSSGTIDFQSHTSYHHTVFTGKKIVDFVNPNLRPYFIYEVLNPVLRKNKKDIFPEKFEWGQPIYQSAPSMSIKRRYIEDENLSAQIINYVRLNGGPAFFKRSRWRFDLNSFVTTHIKKYGINDRFQTLAERYTEIQKDILESKLLIEERLNKHVRHLCYPWYKGSKLSVEASKEVGYHCNYWGVPVNKEMARSKMDPYYLNRISAEFILTLPGRGRIPLSRVLFNKYSKIWIRKVIQQKQNAL
jgi:peptidoglycan/xylan/chitin deacetylase (PgdA/CDA1 family)